MAKRKEIPTDRESNVLRVKAYVVAGITREKIADLMGMDSEVLLREYKKELDTAKEQCIADVAGVLLKKAREGNLSACIFYLKTQGRWREKDEADIKPVFQVFSSPQLTESIEEFVSKNKKG